MTEVSVVGVGVLSFFRLHYLSGKRAYYEESLRFNTDYGRPFLL
ncbi:MAG: hypothetical protein WBB48_08120 [Thermodesulfobacteriota bacterium]